MSKLKIEEFVEKHFGIKLMPQQLEMIAMIAANPEKRFVLEGGRSAGKTTAYKAAMAYLQDGMKPVEQKGVDVGELLLTTVKNAPILPQNLMDVVARYSDYQSHPVMTISKDIKLDPKDLKL